MRRLQLDQPWGDETPSRGPACAAGILLGSQMAFPVLHEASSSSSTLRANGSVAPGPTFADS